MHLLFMHAIFDLSDYMRCVKGKVCAYEKTKAQMGSQLTENVSATFLFGCMGVWLEPNVA